MALIFRIERAKKTPRIAVLRERKEGSKYEVPELLGSFSDRRPFDHITRQLTSEELYEFYNYVSTMRFGKDHFNTHVDQLDRFIFKAPLPLKEVLYKIWQEAAKYGIEFLPEHEMLLAVLNRGKAIEEQLKELTSGQFSALSDLNIDLSESFTQPTYLAYENQKIMSAIFKTELPFEKLADKFNKAAEANGKRAKFDSQYFEIIQEKLLIEGKETFPKWHYLIALLVLKDLKVNLAQVTSPAIITRHWLNVHKQGTLEATIKAFNAAFKELADNQHCHQIIRHSFMMDELTDLGRLPQTKTPHASLIIEKWINHLKKSHDNINADKATAMLKKQYPLLSGNSYIQSLIKKYLA